MQPKEIIAKAKNAWVRMGRPESTVDRMTDAEVAELASLVQVGGTVVEGFLEKITDFTDRYYDARKSTIDSEALTEEATGLEGVED